MEAVQRKPQSGQAGPWRWITGGGILLYGVLALAYLLIGQVNTDEGWYLYAARLVFQGQVPYRDFAYTQTPLLPYLYGLPQALFGASMYLGRVTSLLLAVANLVLCVRLARRYGGEAAAALTALLFVTFTYGIYFEVIVKTYALLTTLFTLTLLVLSSHLDDRVRYPLAVALALGAALARLSAGIFFLVILIYCLVRASRATRLGMLALCALAAAAALLLLLPNARAVEWNLLGHHLSRWGGASLARRMGHILGRRVPGLAIFYLSYTLLALALAVVVLSNTRARARVAAYLRPLHPLVVVGTGLVLFALSHLATGGFYGDYFVPAITSLFPILAVVYVGTYRSLAPARPGRRGQVWARALLQMLLAAALVLVPLRHSAEHVDLSGGRLPIEEVRDVARIVAGHTGATDRLLTLEALWIAVESGRAVLPGLNMAQFSYVERPTGEARQLGLVNGEILLDYIEQGAARVVVLTELDWDLLQETGYAGPIRAALAGGYALLLERDQFGQHAGQVFVYQRLH